MSLQEFKAAVIDRSSQQNNVRGVTKIKMIEQLSNSSKCALKVIFYYILKTLLGLMFILIIFHHLSTKATVSPICASFT